MLKTEGTEGQRYKGTKKVIWPTANAILFLDSRLNPSIRLRAGNAAMAGGDLNSGGLVPK